MTYELTVAQVVVDSLKASSTLESLECAFESAFECALVSLL